MAIMAELPKPNPFVSPPPKPNINDSQVPTSFPEAHHSFLPALKSFQRRTHYHRPIPSSGLISSEPDGRSVVLDYSFEFQFSNSEIPKARPLAVRELAYLSFAPPSMARPWTGKPNRKKVPLVNPLCPPDPDNTTSPGPKVHTHAVVVLWAIPEREEDEGGDSRPPTQSSRDEGARPPPFVVQSPGQSREGRPDMLELVHTHWTHGPVCQVRCGGFPTVDINNICRHLEVVFYTS